MRIPLADVPLDGLQLAGTTTFELEAGAGADDPSACGPVTYELSVTEVGGRQRLSGFLSTTVEMSCSRCARRYELYLKRDFEVLYQQASGKKGPAPENTGR